MNEKIVVDFINGSQFWDILPSLGGIMLFNLFCIAYAVTYAVCNYYDTKTSLSRFSVNQKCWTWSVAFTLILTPTVILGFLTIYSISNLLELAIPGILVFVFIVIATVNSRSIRDICKSKVV